MCCIEGEVLDDVFIALAVGDEVWRVFLPCCQFFCAVTVAVAIGGSGSAECDGLL